MVFAETQNKLLFVITGKTAAEIIVSRASATMPSMALTSWKGSVGNAQMEKMIEQVYEQFDAKRKAEEARRADAEDLEEIKKLEQNIKNRKK
jgi:hypothetical protein